MLLLGPDEKEHKMTFCYFKKLLCMNEALDCGDVAFGRLDCISKFYGPLINIAPFLTLFTSCSTPLFTESGTEDEFKTRCPSLLSSDAADGIRSSTLTRKDCSRIHSYCPGHHGPVIFQEKCHQATQGTHDTPQPLADNMAPVLVSRHF